MQKKRTQLIILFFSIIVWLVLLKQSLGIASNIELILSSLIYFLCLIPSLIYFSRYEKTLPFLPAFSAIYFIYFGLGVFTRYDYFQESLIGSEEIIKTLTLIFIGLISLFVAYYSPFITAAQTMLPRLKLSWDSRRSYRLGIYAGFIGGIVHYQITADPRFTLLSEGTTAFIAELSRFAIVILFLLQLQNKLNFHGKLFLWLFLCPLRIAVDLSTGSLSSVFVDLMILLLVYIYVRQRIPFLRLAVVALVFIAFFGARPEFRTLTWGGEYEKLNPVKKSFLYIKLACNRSLGQKQKYLAEDYELLSARTDALVTFARIVNLTPDYIPYWGGYTYHYLYTSFIPRFLFPGKPLKLVGQEFGHRYGLLGTFDYTTSYNLPALVEMYINFGFAGVIIGMFILGSVFRILHILLNHPQAGEGGLIIYTIIALGLVNIESDISLMCGNTIQYIVLLYIIVKLNIIKPDIGKSPFK